MDSCPPNIAPPKSCSPRVRVDRYQRGMVRTVPPRFDQVLFELVHFDGRRLVVGVQDVDEVGDGEHPDELLQLAVPQRGRAKT